MAAFTTIAAGVGMATTAATTGMSFAQAAAQKKMRDEANKAAAQAMADARKSLGLNVYEGLAIQKEPYELQREAMLTQGAGALQAGVEGEGRGAAATAGRVQMAQQAGQAQVRAAMGQEMAQLEQLTAAEESRLRDIGVQLDLEEVAGAQQAARDAEVARTAALQQGMQGVVSLAGQLATFAPLYEKSQQARALKKAADVAGGMENFQQAAVAQGLVPEGLSLVEFQDRITQLPVADIKRATEFYRPSYVTGPSFQLPSPTMPKTTLVNPFDVTPQFKSF